MAVVAEPAASAGGACILWDYGFIEEQIGVKFTVAASDTVDDTSTCVVRTETADAPYLMLTVVATTTADADLFPRNLMPDRATKLKGLGQTGYRLIRKATSSTGPTVEVGWLSEAEQLQSLNVEMAVGHVTDAVTVSEPAVPLLDTESATISGAITERELQALERDTSKLEKVQSPFPRLSYDEAAEILKKKGLPFEWGGDFGAPDETALSEEFDRPICVRSRPYRKLWGIADSVSANR